MWGKKNRTKPNYEGVLCQFNPHIERKKEGTLPIEVHD